MLISLRVYLKTENFTSCSRVKRCVKKSRTARAHAVRCRKRARGPHRVEPRRREGKIQREKGPTGRGSAWRPALGSTQLNGLAACRFYSRCRQEETRSHARRVARTEPRRRRREERKKERCRRQSVAGMLAAVTRSLGPAPEEMDYLL